MQLCVVVLDVSMYPPLCIHLFLLFSCLNPDLPSFFTPCSRQQRVGMARLIATSLATLALWLAYCLSGVAWRLLRIARHRPETAADAVRFGLLGAAKVAPHGLLYPAAMIESATVVAVGARDPSRAQRLASRWGIPRSGDYASVLADPAVEAVYIHVETRTLAG